MGLCTALHDWVTNEEYGEEVTYCAQCGVYDAPYEEPEFDADDWRDHYLELEAM